MAKKNRTCCVCGTKYTYCNSCAEYSHAPTWLAAFHDENCKDIFETSGLYNGGLISDEEAIAKFDKLNIENYEDFKSEGVKISLRKLYEKNKVESEIIEKEEIIEKDEIIEMADKQVVEEDEIQQKGNTLVKEYTNAKKKNRK